jgi:hypothetical protein
LEHRELRKRKSRSVTARTYQDLEAKTREQDLEAKYGIDL